MRKYRTGWRVSPSATLCPAASLLMVLPAVLLFFTAQRYFVRGFVMSGIKG